jgi:hypothetical protein
MSDHALLLIVPVIGGVLIAAAILALHGLRDRHERMRQELDEARRLDRMPLRTVRVESPSADLEGRRIAS